MKFKLFSLLLLGCTLTAGYFLIFSNENIKNTIDEFVFIDSKVVNKNAKQVDSFIETYSVKSSLILAEPDLTINNNLGGNAGYRIENQNGIKTFLRCTNNASNSGNFQFEDPNSSTYPSGTTFNLDWGDGSPTSNQVESHEYSADLYTLTYTVSLTDGTVNTTKFKVFVGSSSLPSVIINYSGKQCIPGDYTFSIIVDNNLPGTTYTVSINDGSDPIILQSSDYPIGSGFTETLTHTFENTSCETSSIVSGVEFTNAYSISVTASNPCSPEGSFNSVGPIRVSEKTEADYTIPNIVCTNFNMSIRDISETGTNTLANNCNHDYSRYWEISPDTNYTLIEGSQLGSDNGSPEDWTTWNNGSENLRIVFEESGEYFVTLVTRNSCEDSSITKRINVIEPVPPVGVEASGTDESCVDENIFLNGSTKGATGSVKWTADVGGGTFDNDTTLNPTYTPPEGYLGDVTFTMTFKNSEPTCETESDTHTVNITGPLLDAGSYSNAFCTGDSIALNPSIDSDPSSTIKWSSSDGGSFDDPNDPNTNFTPPEGFVGTLTLTIEINVPSSTCSENSDSVEIEFLPKGEVDGSQLNDLEFCNSEVTSEIIFDSPNDSSFRWEIDGNIGLTPQSGTGNLPSFRTSNSTQTSIEAIVTVTPYLINNTIECEGTPETFIISVRPDPKISGTEVLENYNSEHISCFGESDGFITLSDEGAALFDDPDFNYEWIGPNGFTNSNPNLENLEPGTYELEVTDLSNPDSCIFTVLEVKIEEPQPLEITNIETHQAFCFRVDDASISFSIEGGTPPFTSNFGPIDTNSGITIENLSSGIYNIEVIDDNGCEISQEIEIDEGFINNTPPPTGDSIQFFCREDLPISLSELSARGLEIKWYLSPSDEEALTNDYLITGNVVFYARNLDRRTGCLSSETLEVTTNIIDGILDINNYISVNGNRQNNNLNIVNIEHFPDNEMKIYNRYGKLVWETTSYDNTDNTFKGASNVKAVHNQKNFLPTGTYYYILSYRSPCNTDIKKGFLQIDNKSR